MLVPFLKLGNEFKTSPLRLSREDFHDELKCEMIDAIFDSWFRRSPPPPPPLPPERPLCRCSSDISDSFTNLICKKYGVCCLSWIIQVIMWVYFIWQVSNPTGQSQLPHILYESVHKGTKGRTWVCFMCAFFARSHESKWAHNMNDTKPLVLYSAMRLSS